MSTLAHFPLELNWEDYYFLGQAAEDFDHGLDSVSMDSIKTSELGVSCEDFDVVAFSVSSGFLYFISTVSNNSVFGSVIFSFYGWKVQQEIV